VAGLREGRLHAAVMMQPSKQAARGIRFETLRSYPIQVAVGPGHRWAGRRTVTVPELRTESLAVYARKEFPDYHDFLARSIGRALKKLRMVEECDSGPSMIAAVEAGRGICACASILAASAGKRLKFITIVPAPRPAVVGIAYPGNRISGSLAAMVETAKTLRF
jgi:LysR family transcriptional regulator, benzoate and cis,cis-muconate-responsive activator of ben and cat genes